MQEAEQMAGKLVEIPRDANEVLLRFGERELRLTNLRKPFWKKLGVTKRDLLQYYADISPWLVPHLQDRAMVMKRYPNGAEGEFFYMKRAPEPRPDWIEICGIQHNAGLVNFPIVQDLSSLLWLINLGCIDLNPWYARCDDTDRPDFLHFDLDPGPGSDFETVRQVAFRVRDILAALKMPLYAKTTGSKGIHLYIPIVRGPLQKEVWTFAKAIAIELESRHPDIITAEYRKVNRPYARVLVDYNQNAWGRTLASIYSVRPAPRATVSAPVAWEELEAGVTIDDFDMFNIVARVEEIGDLWKPVLGKKRYELRDVFGGAGRKGSGGAGPKVPGSQGPKVERGPGPKGKATATEELAASPTPSSRKKVVAGKASAGATKSKAPTRAKSATKTTTTKTTTTKAATRNSKARTRK